MARVRKISDEQFALDCVNKEFEIIGSGLHWDTFKELCEWSKLEENKNWFSDHSFTSEEQYLQWKNYFFEHFYDWKPKRYPLRTVEREFSWFSLMYGFTYDFDPKPVGKYV